MPCKSSTRRDFPLPNNFPSLPRAKARRHKTVGVASLSQIESKYANKRKRRRVAALFAICPLPPAVAMFVPARTESDAFMRFISEFIVAPLYFESLVFSIGGPDRQLSSKRRLRRAPVLNRVLLLSPCVFCLSRSVPFILASGVSFAVGDPNHDRLFHEASSPLERP